MYLFAYYYWARHLQSESEIGNRKPETGNTSDYEKTSVRIAVIEMSFFLEIVEEKIKKKVKAIKGTFDVA